MPAICISYKKTNFVLDIIQNHKTTMKKILLLFLLTLPVALHAQKAKDDTKYLAGAVTTRDGYVCFEKTYQVPGTSKAELFRLLKEYTQKVIVEGENHLEQARITEDNQEDGIIAASIEEYLYFKRKAWTMHRVRFYYQLVYQIEDGKFSITMRRLHYLYDDINAGDYAAENWITDSEALSKDGTKLTRIAGKFRRFTIDRKDEIFKGAARAAGAIKKVSKVIEVEE